MTIHVSDISHMDPFIRRKLNAYDRAVGRDVRRCRRPLIDTKLGTAQGVIKTHALITRFPQCEYTLSACPRSGADHSDKGFNCKRLIRS